MGKYGLAFTEPSLTKQSFARECDINLIMAKYARTGVLSHVNEAMPRYDDVSQVGDFREAQERVIRGKDLFALLSPEAREIFQNDPSRFFEFVADPANEREVVKLGFGPKALEVLDGGQKSVRRDGDNVEIQQGGPVKLAGDTGTGAPESKGEAPSEGAEGAKP